MIVDHVHPSPATAAPIVLVRTYPAPPVELWELWTTKEGFESWWGPQGFRVEVHTLEARAGGAIHYDMIAATPEMVAAMAAVGQPPSHPVHTRFDTFRQHTHLALVSVIDFLPGVPAYDSRIDVEFEDMGHATRMTVTLHPMHSEDFSGMQHQGFASQLTKLDARYGA